MTALRKTATAITLTAAAAGFSNTTNANPLSAHLPIHLPTPQVAPIVGCKAEFEGKTISMETIAARYLDGSPSDAQKDKYTNTFAALRAKGCVDGYLESGRRASLVFILYNGSNFNAALKEQNEIFKQQQTATHTPYASLDTKPTSSATANGGTQTAALDYLSYIRR